LWRSWRTSLELGAEVSPERERERESGGETF
jgi:hypothetical protein